MLIDHQVVAGDVRCYEGGSTALWDVAALIDLYPPKLRQAGNGPVD